MPRIVNGKIVADDEDCDRALGVSPQSRPASSAFPSSSFGGGSAGAGQALVVLLLLYVLFGGGSAGSLLKYALVGVAVYAVLTAANTPRGATGAGRNGGGGGGGGGGWNVRGVGDLPKPPSGG